MVPYTTHQPAALVAPHSQQQVIPQPAHPTPQVFTYSHGHSVTSPPHLSKNEINAHPSTTVAPLHQSGPQFGYNNKVAPIQFQIKKPATTSYQQYYSPGLEYHFSEVVPNKVGSQVYPASYNAPPTVIPTQQSYQQSYPQAVHYNQQQYSQYPSYNAINDYQKVTPFSNYITYARPQVAPLKQQVNYQQQYPQYQVPQTPQAYNSHQTSQIYNSHQAPQSYNTHQVPQTYNSHQVIHPQSQIYTTQQQQVYQPPPYHQSQQNYYNPYSASSSDAYNTIKYSVPLPPYDHSKRAVTKATAINKKA